MTVLFVIGTIILFLGLDWLVRRFRGETSRVPAQAAGGYPLRIPEGIFFSKSHTWVNLYPTGKLLLGVDDFVARLIGPPEIVHLRKAGEQVRKGEPLLRLTSGAHSLTIQSPIDGEVLKANEELARHPELLRQNLFNEGWSYLIRPSRIAQVKEFLLAGETKEWIREEFRRLKDFFAGMGETGATVPVYLQDGGPPAAGALTAMDGAAWTRFENEFLQAR